MENQDTTNINPISSPAQTPIPPVSPVIPASIPKSSLFPILFVVLILVLLAATGVFAYQNMQLQKQIAILQSQPTSSPIVSASPTPTADPTANWKTFITDDKKVSFKYPSGWTADQNTTSEGWGKSITTANLKNDKFHLSVSVANAFMNECMQEISKQTITLSETTFYKRYFTGVYLNSGEACSNKENLENSEIWLQPTLIDKEPYNYQGN